MKPITHISGLVRVEYVNGFYFAALETENYSAEVLRATINASAFSASEWDDVKTRLEARGYKLASLD